MSQELRRYNRYATVEEAAKTMAAMAADRTTGCGVCFEPVERGHVNDHFRKYHQGYFKKDKIGGRD